MFKLFLLVLFCLTCEVISQPGGGGGGPGGDVDGGSGGEAITGCEGLADGEACPNDGSGNFIQYIDVTFDTQTGMWSGSILSNQCGDHEQGWYNGEYLAAATPTAECTLWEFPTTDYPAAGSLLGALGVTVSGGISVNNPFEGGFQTGLACEQDDVGDCDAGVDVVTCFSELAQECGYENIDWGFYEDTCGGHAVPYHYHGDLVCNYDDESSSSHSELVAIALDGRGLYGKFEGDGEKPNDLDACSGHYGPVPAFTGPGGEEFESAENVYHYHTNDQMPNLLVCYGPAETIQDCKDLYPDTCDDGTINICTDMGEIDYDVYCPCFRDATGATYNQDYVSTDSCPYGDEQSEASEASEKETGRGGMMPVETTSTSEETRRGGRPVETTSTTEPTEETRRIGRPYDYESTDEESSAFSVQFGAYLIAIFALFF